MEPPTTYLGATISTMDNVHGGQCWAMSSDQYCAALVTTTEDELQKKGLKLPSKCFTSLSNGYKPAKDCTAEQLA